MIEASSPSKAADDNPQLQALHLKTPSCNLTLQTLNNAKMNAQRVGLRLGRTLRRSSDFRSTVQRRFESTAEKLPKPGQKLVGPQDNAFNRERAAVKAHAAATSGMPKMKAVINPAANWLNRSLAKIIYLVRTNSWPGFSLRQDTYNR